MQLTQVKKLLTMHKRHKLDTMSELELLMFLWDWEEEWSIWQIAAVSLKLLALNWYPISSAACSEATALALTIR